MVVEYKYRSGHRPLQGYTIKRALGRGGFGEVYYAISDSGKEVALKIICRSSESEQRGIRHCLNFKHPNLVQIYDLRTTTDGQLCIIMEFVAGESLAQLIRKNPQGLSPLLVREWFAALARAVHYLHDKGVVHRDLKPGNIFIEEGHLKLGDYGLVRGFSSFDQERMTCGVGTPHYMAPEIYNGVYGPSVDIYACGVILYEMLTGRLPFEGEAPVEQFHRHLFDSPNLSPLPEAWQPIIAKALAKDPQQRYQKILEFAHQVEKVFQEGAVPLRTPLPPPYKSMTMAPAPATQAATQMTSQTVPGATSVTATPPPLSVPRMPPPLVPSSHRSVANHRQTPTVVPLRSLRQKIRDFTWSMLKAAFICAVLGALLFLVPAADSWMLAAKVTILAVCISWSVFVLALLAPPQPRSTWFRRLGQLLIGVAIGLFAAWLDGWGLPQISTAEGVGTYQLVLAGYCIDPALLGVGLRYSLYFGLTMAAIPWWHIAQLQRQGGIWRKFFLGGISLMCTAIFLLLSLGESVRVWLFASPMVFATAAVLMSVPKWNPPSASPSTGSAAINSHQGNSNYTKQGVIGSSV